MPRTRLDSELSFRKSWIICFGCTHHHSSAFWHSKSQRRSSECGPYTSITWELRNRSSQARLLNQKLWACNPSNLCFNNPSKWLLVPLPQRIIWMTWLESHPRPWLGSRDYSGLNFQDQIKWRSRVPQNRRRGKVYCSRLKHLYGYLS